MRSHRGQGWPRGLLSFVVMILNIAVRLSEATTAMWVDCHDIATNFSAPPSGGNFEAIGCNFPDRVTFASFSALSIGVGATAFISHGHVEAGISAGVLVIAPSSSDARLRGPVHITISSMTFGHDAAFRFSGALPPSSTLVIANSSFFLTRINTFFNTPYPNNVVYSVPSTIQIDSRNAALQLTAATNITIENNTVAGNGFGQNDFFSAVCILSTSASLNDRSTVSINHNRIVNSVISNYAFVAYWFLSNNNNFALYNQSRVSMSGNSITNTSVVTARVSYIHVFSFSANSITLWNQSTISMTDNRIQDCSIIVAYVAQLYSGIGVGKLSLQGQSAITINRNRLINSTWDNDAYVASLHLYSSQSIELELTIALDEQSAIYMCDNIVSGSIAGNANLAFLHIQNYWVDGRSRFDLLNNSTLSLSGNRLLNSISRRNDAIFAYVSLVSSKVNNSQCSIGSGSEIFLSGNTVECNGATRAVKLEVFGHLQLSSQSTVYVDGNTVKNTKKLYWSPFQISSSKVTVSEGSVISFDGNRLDAAASAVPPSMLSITSTDAQSMDAYAYVCELCSFLITNNEANASTVLANISLAVVVTGTLAVHNNKVVGASRCLFQVGAMDLYGSLQLDNNTIVAPYPIHNYLLVNLSTLTLGSKSMVKACGNNASWKPYFLAPVLYLRPSTLAYLAGQCVISSTFSPSLTRTVLIQRTRTASPSGFVTETGTPYIKTRTITSSMMRSESVSAFDAPTSTLDGSATATSSGSGVVTSTIVEAPSRSIEYSPSASLTSTTSAANCSNGSFCQLLVVRKNLTSSLDLCEAPNIDATEVPRSAPFLPLSSYGGVSASEQASIEASYSGLLPLPFGTPSANAYTYGSLNISWLDGRITNVTSCVIPAASLSVAACWVYASSAKLVVFSLAVSALMVSADSATHPESIQVLVVQLTVHVNCTASNFTFNQTLALERPVTFLSKQVFVPEKAVKNTMAATGAMSVTVGAVAVPVAAMQQGVAMALLRIAQCEEDALNGEPLDVPVHPLQFGIGDGDAKYGRGAVVANLLVIPVVWCLFAYSLIPFAFRALSGRSLKASRDFVGWPGMTMMPFAVLCEGSAMASVALLATRTSAVDGVLGSIGLAILLATGGCWGVEVWRMKSRIVRIRVPCGGGFGRLTRPRFEWDVIKISTTTSYEEITLITVRESPASYLDKRVQLIGSSWWLWSAFIAHTLSFVVGVAEGLPVSPSMCKVRWAVASVAAVLQSAVVMTATVPIELTLLGAVSALNCVLVVLVALSTFDFGTSDTTFTALNAVGITSSVLGMSLLMMGAGIVVFEIASQGSRCTRTHRMAPPYAALQPPALSQPLMSRRSSIDVELLPPPSAPPSISFQPRHQPDLEEAGERVAESIVTCGSGRYSDLPAHWAKVLDDIDQATELAETKKRHKHTL